MFEAKVLTDTLHPKVDSRLTTMQLTYPRCIHTEFMTHRQFSRNAASSRAIPTLKLIEQVETNPFVPIHWGKNQKGMQAEEVVEDDMLPDIFWKSGAELAVHIAKQLHELGLHKQIVNRVIEPYMWITVIVTGVDHAWENFFKLRCHKDAEPHIQKIAYMAREKYDEQEILEVPTNTPEGIHAPLTGFEGDSELSRYQLQKVSVGRCARVSYLTHDGKRDVSKDLELHDRLAESGHWSPFEHVAWEANDATGTSNFGPHWHQYRKQFHDEYCRQAPRD